MRAASELTALLIAPGRELAAEFKARLAETRAFQILAELKSYPGEQALEMRLRQIQPEVVLLDLATDLEKACGLIVRLVAAAPGVHVVGLHRANDSEAVMRSLRVGASEFLYAPFDPEVQKQALERIRRLLGPREEEPREPGRVLLFTSAKPGAGASMLAAQLGFALERRRRRVLLADLDPMGGTISFYLKAPPRPGDATVPAADWISLATPVCGLDVLAAPAIDAGDSMGPVTLAEFLEAVRQHYDWAVLDLPAVFHRLTLLALPEADSAFLVSTPELPSLHLARKAVVLLKRLGFGPERFTVLINRVDGRMGLRESDVSKMIDCPVEYSFPHDFHALDRAVAAGEPVAASSELGKSVESFARRLTGGAAGRGVQVARPVLTGVTR